MLQLARRIPFLRLGKIRSCLWKIFVNCRGWKLIPPSRSKSPKNQTDTLHLIGDKKLKRKKMLKNTGEASATTGVIERLKKREAAGFAKYNTFLQFSNGRSHANDVHEELLDSVCYFELLQKVLNMTFEEALEYFKALNLDTFVLCGGDISPELLKFCALEAIKRGQDRALIAVAVGTILLNGQS